MTTQAVDRKGTEEKSVARPLGVLADLIKEAMADEQRAAMEYRVEVGRLLLEAQQRMINATRKDPTTPGRPSP